MKIGENQRNQIYIYII